MAASAIRAPVAPIAEPMPTWARTSLRSTAMNGAPVRAGAHGGGQHARRRTRAQDDDRRS